MRWLRGNVSNVISIDYFPDQAPDLLQSLLIIRLLQIYEAASPPRVHCNLINVTAEVHKHRKKGEGESSSDFSDKIVTVRNVSRAGCRDP
mgnify:CR=1 FL=1